MKKCWILLAFICFFFNGCGRKTDPSVRVVTRVDVTCEQGRHTIHRQYTQPKKIGQVLTYLRLQESLGAVEVDPERLTGPVFRIDVRLSDGSDSVYYQQGNLYLSKKYHPWQKIDPEKAAEFYQMLRRTPTDL